MTKQVCECNKLLNLRSISYKQGLKDGITRFAWWKDGTQYVGTCGNTLKNALKEIDNEFKEEE